MASRGGVRLQQCRARSGFTLIELLIALVLLEVGLLALVGLTAASTRDVDAARRDAAALNLAWARLERTASVSCHDTESGASPAGPGLSEWYDDIVEPNGTRVISDSVVVVTTRGTHAIVLRTGARC